jgi:hypothetical protein
VLWLGDAVDGTPLTAVDGEPWSEAVQAFPDQPPTPRGHADSHALEAEGLVLTQGQMISRVAEDDVRGTLGIDAATVGAADALLAVAVRPLLAGRPTVVLAGASREAAAGEQVARWAS